MTEKKKNEQDAMLDVDLEKVSGGSSIIDVSFIDAGKGLEKAFVRIEDGEIKESRGLDKLNDRDKDALRGRKDIPDGAKRKMGVI